MSVWPSNTGGEFGAVHLFTGKTVRLVRIHREIRSGQERGGWLADKADEFVTSIWLFDGQDEFRLTDQGAVASGGHFAQLCGYWVSMNVASRAVISSG